MRTAAEILRQAGIRNPVRITDLIREIIERLELDLRGASVITEAATGSFVVTPVIASAAGADRVLALTSESPYGSVDEVRLQTRALESLADITTPCDIRNRGSVSSFADADIVTNLGFVRPIDRRIVETMRSGTVVPLMCEAWEIRPGDVDIDACRRNDIRVIGTNEDFPELDAFNYIGDLATKLLLEAQIELGKARILIVSTDKFGRAIAGVLQRIVSSVEILPQLKSGPLLNSFDAVILADYTRTDTIIGEGGDVELDMIADEAPGTTIIQIAGASRLASAELAGVVAIPGIDLGARRMALTPAAVSARPVVELHAAGLKTAEMVFRGRGHDDPFWGLVQFLE